MVYAYWDSSPTAPAHQAEMVLLWRRTWSKWGWTPRLLLAKTAAKHRGKGKPTYTTVTTMNLGWRPGRTYHRGELMKFPDDYTADQVLSVLKRISEEMSALV